MIIEQYLSERSLLNKNILDESVYDIKELALAKEFICESYINHQINLNDFKSLNELLDLTESDINDDYLYEGANLDSRKFYIKFKKQIRNNIHKAKKSMRRKNYKEAKKYLEEANKNIDDCIKAIKDCDSTAGSVILGFFTQALPMLGRTLLLSIFPMVSGINLVKDVLGKSNDITQAILNNNPLADVSVSEIINSLISDKDFVSNISSSAKKIAIGEGVILFLNTLMQIVRIVKNIKEKHKNSELLSLDDFNFYKNTLLQKLDEFKAFIKYLMKLCDKKEKQK